MPERAENIKEIAQIIGGVFISVFAVFSWISTKFKKGQNEPRRDKSSIDFECKDCTKRIEAIEKEIVRIQTQQDLLRAQNEEQFNLIRDISAALNRLLGALDL